MTMEFEISENNIRLTKSIRQAQEIIDMLNKRSSSENLDKIKHWINKNKPESSQFENDNIFVAIKIDIIHCYLKKEFHKEIAGLIESYLCILISYPAKDKLDFLENLKKFIITEDDEVKSELKKFFVKKSPSSIQSNLTNNMSNKITSAFEKSKLIFNAVFKANNVETAEFASEVARINSIEGKVFFSGNIAYSPEFLKAPSKEKISRKKIKTRIIKFDDDGIGYDHSSSHWYYKEVKRLAKINLEIEVSPRMIFKEEWMRMQKIHIGEILLLKELEQLKQKELEKKIAEQEFKLFSSDEEKKIRHQNLEAKWKEEEAKEKEKKQAKQRAIKQSIKNSKNFREYLRNNQKKIAQVKKISKLLDPILFFIQEQIDQCKEKSANINNNLLDIKLPSFGALKDDFITDFLKTVDYEKFKELINFAENILFSINAINKTLNKIKVFSKNLGISVEYIRSLDDSHKKIKKNFSRNAIINFLESSVDLFKQRTLTLDNNYCLLEIKDKKEEIEYSEPVFFDLFISNNDLEQIFKLNFAYLNQFFNQNIDIILFNKRYLRNKDNLLTILSNFFSGKYYFLSQKRKDKFLRNFFLKIQKASDFEIIKTKVFRLKWWHFISAGINPFHIFREGFRELLSEKLFLNLIEEEFKNIDKEPCIKSIDDLYSIYERLKISNIAIKNQSIKLPLINIPLSRQEIVDSFNKHQEVKNLLAKIGILANHTAWGVNEFSKLLNTLQEEHSKISPCFALSKKEFLRINEMNRSVIPNDNTSNLSLSYGCRSIN